MEDVDGLPSSESTQSSNAKEEITVCLSVEYCKLFITVVRSKRESETRVPSVSKDTLGGVLFEPKKTRVSMHSSGRWMGGWSAVSGESL